MSILIHEISKKFAPNTEREVAALDNISLRIEDHQFVSIVGPSGCGKTTLLKIVAGLVKPDSGQVTFTGVQKYPSALMVFQDQGLLPWLNILDNIGLGLELKGIKKSVRKTQVLEFMDRFRLIGFENHYPHELSIGMRQRVALARAFLTNPDHLLMDEPFGSLDAQTRLILQEELLRIWRAEQNTVLFVTHDIDEAILLSDQIIVLSDRPGKLKNIIQIPLGRPRDIEIKDHPNFIKIRKQIWGLLEQEIRRELKLT